MCEAQASDPFRARSRSILRCRPRKGNRRSPRSRATNGSPVNLWITPAEARSAIAHGDGHGVRIAVLDSGIEITHPDFMGRSLSDDINFESSPASSPQPGNGVDRYGHGTALAGILWKVAPGAEIGSFRVLGPNLNARTAAVACAAQEAISRGYHILNCSFACMLPGHLPIYKDWVDRAALAGIHVVAAGTRNASRNPEWPAHFTSVLGVDCHAAPRTPLQLARNGEGIVEFSAQGENVRVPWRDSSHRTMTGSSFAAAHLSGLLARLLSVHPLRDVHLVKALLRQVAD